MTRYVYSLDCKSMDDNLRDEIVKLINDGHQVDICYGTFRQNKFTDNIKSKEDKLPSVFKRYPDFVHSIKEKLPAHLKDKITLIDLLTPDVLMNKTPGFHAQHYYRSFSLTDVSLPIGGEANSRTSTPPQSSNDQDSKRESFVDMSKISIFYAQMHHISKLYPKENNIQFMVKDWRIDRLTNLREFYNTGSHRKLIPDNITLCLSKKLSNNFFKSTSEMERLINDTDSKRTKAQNLKTNINQCRSIEVLHNYLDNWNAHEDCKIAKISIFQIYKINIQQTIPPQLSTEEKDSYINAIEKCNGVNELDESLKKENQIKEMLKNCLDQLQRIITEETCIKNLQDTSTNIDNIKNELKKIKADLADIQKNLSTIKKDALENNTLGSEYIANLIEKADSQISLLLKYTTTTKNESIRNRFQYILQSLLSWIEKLKVIDPNYDERLFLETIKSSTAEQIDEIIRKADDNISTLKQQRDEISGEFAANAIKGHGITDEAYANTATAMLVIATKISSHQPLPDQMIFNNLNREIESFDIRDLASIYQGYSSAEFDKHFKSYILNQSNNAILVAGICAAAGLAIGVTIGAALVLTGVFAPLGVGLLGVVALAATAGGGLAFIGGALGFTAAKLTAQTDVVASIDSPTSNGLNEIIGCSTKSMLNSMSSKSDVASVVSSTSNGLNKITANATNSMVIQDSKPSSIKIEKHSKTQSPGTVEPTQELIEKSDDDNNFAGYSSVSAVGP